MIPLQHTLPKQLLDRADAVTGACDDALISISLIKGIIDNLHATGTALSYYKINKHRVCYKCRCRGHLAKDCGKICSYCQETHPTEQCYKRCVHLMEESLNAIKRNAIYECKRYMDAFNNISDFDNQANLRKLRKVNAASLYFQSEATKTVKDKLIEDQQKAKPKFEFEPLNFRNLFNLTTAIDNTGETTSALQIQHLEASSFNSEGSQSNLHSIVNYVTALPKAIKSLPSKITAKISNQISQALGNTVSSLSTSSAIKIHLNQYAIENWHGNWHNIQSANQSNQSALIPKAHTGNLVIRNNEYKLTVRERIKRHAQIMANNSANLRNKVENQLTCLKNHDELMKRNEKIRDHLKELKSISNEQSISIEKKYKHIEHLQTKIEGLVQAKLNAYAKLERAQDKLDSVYEDVDNAYEDMHFYEQKAKNYRTNRKANRGYTDGRQNNGNGKRRQGGGCSLEQFDAQDGFYTGDGKFHYYCDLEPGERREDFLEAYDHGYDEGDDRNRWYDEGIEKGKDDC